MKLFRQDNTAGYTDSQLESLNEEWQERAKELNLEENTDDYDFYAKAFCDEVARR